MQLKWYEVEVKAIGDL